MKARIFCLEGEWENSLKKNYSVETYLKYLHEAFGVRYIYRKVNSKESLFKYLDILNRQQSAYQEYSVIYLAFHGKTKTIYLDTEEFTTLDELAEKAGNAFKNKTVHFGSCRTLLASNSFVEDFRKKTGAKMVSGYSKTIDFFDSSLLDLAYLNAVVKTNRKLDFENLLDKKLGNLRKMLGFKLIR